MADPVIPQGVPPTTRYAFTDRWGAVFADPDGYLYRGPEYRTRFEALQATSAQNDWQDEVTYFRTFRPVDHNTLSLMAKAASDALATAQAGGVTQAASTAANTLLIGGGIAAVIITLLKFAK